MRRSIFLAEGMTAGYPVEGVRGWNKVYGLKEPDARSNQSKSGEVQLWKAMEKVV
jgi:hypothetical protein